MADIFYYAHVVERKREQERKRRGKGAAHMSSYM